jgi:ribosomal protein L6P/L9E
MGKAILTEQFIEIPANVKCEVKGRVVTSVGDQGTVSKTLPNAPVLVKKIKKDGKDFISVSMYFGHKKHNCIVKSMAGHIKNTIIGAAKGFKSTMRYGFKRHPMKPVAADDGKSIAISLFLGKKDISVVTADEGCHIECDKDEKNKVVYVSGLDPCAVGNTCLRIYHTCVPRRLDRRKFLDGIYV